MIPNIARAIDERLNPHFEHGASIDQLVTNGNVVYVRNMPPTPAD